MVRTISLSERPLLYPMWKRWKRWTLTDLCLQNLSEATYVIWSQLTPYNSSNTPTRLVPGTFLTLSRRGRLLTKHATSHQPMPQTKTRLDYMAIIAYRLHNRCSNTKAVLHSLCISRAYREFWQATTAQKKKLRKNASRQRRKVIGCSTILCSPYRRPTVLSAAQR